MTPPDPSALWDAERRARLALSHVTEPNTPILIRIAQEGASAILDQISSGHLDRDGAYAARRRSLDIDRSIHNLHIAGVRYLVPGDPEWPVGVEDLPGPPVGLFVRGPLDLGAATERAVGVVGARAATTYGVHVATELGTGLVDRGATVVSGAAFGIDAAAHRGALGAEGPTIAVLACGLDRPYPTAHTALIDRIGAVGLVVSEIPLGGAPFRSRFLARNRLIDLSVGEGCVYAHVVAGQTAKYVRDMCRSPGAVRRNNPVQVRLASFA